MAVDFSPANERDALTGFLDKQRDALIRKARGVNDFDARRAPTTSSLSLLGLLKHLTVWEQRWFQGVVAGRPLPDGWPESRPQTPDLDFLVDEADTVAQWVSHYEHAVGVSRQIVAAMDLDHPCARTDIIDGNLRWVLLHLIEETARHVGHADIIRETLDGSRGL
ncbi:DinB family protein [Nocardia terpenica]|uniref:DinB family protein n=1 Tax=Nocardia terpenica TaxID=455432 RepID=UPI0012FE59B3|nr:DinB family protein [Nocardia terpenica]